MASQKPPDPAQAAPLPFGLKGAMLVGGCLAVCIAAAVAVARDAPAGDRVPHGLLELLVAGVPMLAGAYVLRSPPHRRSGQLLIAAGAALALMALGEASADLPAGVARVAGWAVLPILVLLLLAFPRDRPATRVDRGLFALSLVIAGGLYAGSAPFSEAFPSQIPRATCDPDCAANAFMLLDSEPAVVGSLVQPLRELLTIILLLGVSGSLLHRGRIASPFGRRALGPVVATGVACAGGLVLWLAAREAAADGAAADALGHVWTLTVPGLGCAVVAGLAAQRMMLGDTLAALYRDLHRPDVASLRATLAGQLGTDTLDLLLPDRRSEVWHTTDGVLVTSGAVEREGRRLTVIRDERDRTIAALAADPALDGDQLIGGVSGAVRTAVRQTRAERMLAHALLELEESRARIAREADVERSRIERDLHDGAQQRLIALRMQLSMAQEQTLGEPERLTISLDSLGAQVDIALEEIRALAHGVYPPILTDRGLEDALRSAAAAAQRRVAFVTRGLGRYPPEVETAVYFTCSEALQNACKYAREGRTVRLALWHQRGLQFEIHDDGPGFAVPEVRTGGLRNMQDRIAAVGGVLTIESAPGRGTRVAGFVPLPHAGADRRSSRERSAASRSAGDD